MLQYVYETPPSQRADDVSTVLGVSVVNELPDIQYFFSYTFFLPNPVNTRYGRTFPAVL